MSFMAILNDLRALVRKDARSHSAIATAAGMHPKTFSAFMNDRRGLSIETIEKLAHALNADIKLDVQRKRKNET